MTQTTETIPTTGYAIVDDNETMWGCGPTETAAWQDAREDWARNCPNDEIDTSSMRAYPATAAVLDERDGMRCRIVGSDAGDICVSTDEARAIRSGAA